VAVFLIVTPYSEGVSVTVLNTLRGKRYECTKFYLYSPIRLSFSATFNKSSLVKLSVMNDSDLTHFLLSLICRGV
jgi:hypothetical protein